MKPFYKILSCFSYKYISYQQLHSDGLSMSQTIGLSSKITKSYKTIINAFSVSIHLKNNKTTVNLNIFMCIICK